MPTLLHIHCWTQTRVCTM